MHNARAFAVTQPLSVLLIVLLLQLRASRLDDVRNIEDGDLNGEID